MARRPRATIKENTMSTHQITRHTPRPATWFALALSGTIAIGASILILALIGPGRTTSPTSTHTATYTHTAGAAAGALAPAGYFRDPVTHALLQFRSTGSEPTPLPDGHDHGHIP
jgi:hypothetical protein